MNHHPQIRAQAVGDDIDGLVRFFHEDARLERRLGRAGTVNSDAAKWAEDLMALRTAYDLVHQRRGAVGTMPPTPHTSRARVGAFLVRLVQRMLFWYTPQINSYNDAVLRMLNHVCTVAESQLTTAQFLSAEIAQLRREVSALSVSSLAPRPPSVPGVEASPVDLPESFYMSFQEHFRGPEREVKDNLSRYLDIIYNFAGTAGRSKASLWLDIGCGRGEWLQCAKNAGHEAIGVDTSAAAVHFCRELHLQAEESDALKFLQAYGDRSVDVITAFHVLEHWTVPYILQFVTEAARVLRPAGLLIVELPNPENLLMGARDFWADPTHCRPIPPPTMEFIFTYCGFSIRKRLDLHPSPEREQLPFNDLEVVTRLNHYLHGPQAFALVGQQ